MQVWTRDCTARNLDLYEISNGPRESFVTERYQRLEQIDRKLTQLSRLRERASELEDVSARKATVQVDIDKKKDRQKAFWQ